MGMQPFRQKDGSGSPGRQDETNLGMLSLHVLGDHAPSGRFPRLLRVAGAECLYRSDIDKIWLRAAPSTSTAPLQLHARIVTMHPAPRVEIVYCTQCHWLLRAAWMAQELLTTFEQEI